MVGWTNDVGMMWSLCCLRGPAALSLLIYIYFSFPTNTV